MRLRHLSLSPSFLSLSLQSLQWQRGPNKHAKLRGFISPSGVITPVFLILLYSGIFIYRLCLSWMGDVDLGRT